MTCSKEEIERKRLAALEKRKSKVFGACSPGNNVLNSTSLYQPSPKVQYKNTGTLSKYTSHPYKAGLKSINSGVKTENGILEPSKVISGTVYLISETRFEVKPSEFATPLIDIFKSIPSKNYDPKSRLWNFHISDYEELMQKVSKLHPHIVLGSIPSYVLQALREPDTRNAVELSPVDSVLLNKLLSFQVEGVKFGISKRGRCLIADDMGLGKTLQALAIASYYRHNWPLLVVTTSSMRETWQSQIHELLPSVPMMNIVTLSSNKDVPLVSDKQTEIVIASYKIAANYVQLLKDKKFGAVIIDESHYLKSKKAQCTVALSAVTKSAQRVILLSGTPALSRPAELYSQLSMVQPNFFKNFTEFGIRYCAGKMSTFGWDMTGQSNLTELQIILQKKFLIRRTKQQVLTNLQDKERESIILDSSLIDWTDDKQSGLSQCANTYMKSKSSERHAALLSFFSETAKVKIPAVRKYVMQLLKDEETRKFLIFAHHRNMIDAICEALDESSVHYICIVGNTRSDLRMNLVETFQSDPCCRCAVLSVTAVNSGVTLTAANLVIFAELHWNPGILVQAESRVHRIGQERNVNVRYLLAKGTSDDHLWPMLQGKLNVLNEVGLSEDNFEEASVKNQVSSRTLDSFFSPVNKNDFITGTNIRKHSELASCSRQSANNNVDQDMDYDFKDLLNDEEGDELLENIDFLL